MVKILAVTNSTGNNLQSLGVSMGLHEPGTQYYATHSQYWGFIWLHRMSRWGIVFHIIQSLHLNFFLYVYKFQASSMQYLSTQPLKKAFRVCCLCPWSHFFSVFSPLTPINTPVLISSFCLYNTVFYCTTLKLSLVQFESFVLS